MMAMLSRVNSLPYRHVDPCWSPWKVEIGLGLLLRELGFFKRKKSKSWRFEVISCTNSEFVATFDVAIPCAGDQALKKNKRRACLASRSRENFKNVGVGRLIAHWVDLKCALALRTMPRCHPGNEIEIYRDRWENIGAVNLRLPIHLSWQEQTVGNNVGRQVLEGPQHLQEDKKSRLIHALLR